MRPRALDGYPIPPVPVGGTRLRSVMPIRPFLSSQAFDPETIDRMSEALQTVCDKLSLKVVDDAATRLVARKIIELTQRGVRDAAALQAMTLKEFKYE
jgi:hypothetical protein